MDAHDLTPEQLAHLRKVLGKHIDYIKKLAERMDRRNWRRDDQLYLAVQKSAVVANELAVALHYADCT